MAAAVEAETELSYKSRRQNAAAPVAAIAGPPPRHGLEARYRPRNTGEYSARTAVTTTTMLRHWVGTLRVTVIAGRFDKVK